MFSWVTSVRSRLSGCFLAICENLLSAVRSNGRKAFAMLMVLFMGVTPVFAADSLADSEGVLTVQRQLFGASQSSYAAVYFFDNETKTITLNDGRYSLKSGTKTVKNPWISPGYYIDFVFSIPESGVISFTDDDNGSYFTGTLVSANDTSLVYHDFDVTEELIVTLFIDDVQKEIITLPEKLSLASYPVNHHVRIRLSSNFVNEEEHVFYETVNERAQLWLGFKLDASFTADEAPVDPDYPDDPTDPSDPSGGGSGSQDLTEVIDSIEVVQGHLEEINGNIVDIKDSVEDIKVQIEDTKQQLEDPTSPIWEAAGSKIKDSITSLFVPTEEELNAKMEEIENIVTEKLGDTVEVVERVEQYEDELVSGFTGGGRQYDFHFPGISVPLPSGTVTILPESDVHIENDAFIIFRDLLGNGVALLCGFAAVHMIHDFLICILSGVTWWGWIRGRHDQ